MRSHKLTIIVVALAFLSVLLLTTSSDSLAVPVEAVIDFEGIPEGAIVDEVYSGYGISGAPLEGSVIVFGFNPDFPPTTNTAMIFDATCTPGGTPADCTGGDADLYNPSFGNTLIISEDLDSSDPDDADVVGAKFGFEYTLLGDGNGAYIESLEVQDVEEEETEDARMYFFEGGLGGALVGSVDIPETGNGISMVVPIGVGDVDAIEIDLQGSGTINNIRLFAEPTAVELLYFNVDRLESGDVNLNWATAAEIDNLGFHIYRASVMDISRAESIHFEPAGGGSAGNTYSYTDSPGEGGWFYWLSDIDTSGVETFHLPGLQSAGYAHQTFLPLLVGK
jgi:hypothetical protein